MNYLNSGTSGVSIHGNAPAKASQIRKEMDAIAQLLEKLQISQEQLVKVLEPVTRPQAHPVVPQGSPSNIKEVLVPLAERLSDFRIILESCVIINGLLLEGIDL
jgi:hypothetical protein